MTDQLIIMSLAIGPMAIGYVIALTMILTREMRSDPVRT